MSGGKETPRQKMIGMMYLVLTALLALNVSKEILNAFVIIEEGLNVTNTNFDGKNGMLYSKFDKALAENKTKTAPWHKKAQEAKKMSIELCAFVDEIKSEMYQKLQKVPKEVADTFQLRNLDGKDDANIPTEILIGAGADPESPTGKAKDLQEKIEKFKKDMTALVPEKERKGLNLGLSTDKMYSVGDHMLISWAGNLFEHNPAAAVLSVLAKIKNDVKNAESDVVSILLKEIDAGDFKFDNVVAKVVAPTSYITLGEEYTADIFIAAYSSTQNPQVLVGNVDTIKNTIIGTPLDVPVSGGVGKYALRPTSEGLQEYSGLINVKAPDGSVKPYRFSGSYMVARPSMAISPTKMNVFYIGVDNPVDISVAGASPTDVVPSMSGGGGSISNQGQGHYTVRVTTPGECKISVSIKTKTGSKAMGTLPFRVKKIPSPLASYAGIIGDGRVGKGELQAAAGVFAKLDNFAFDLNFPVVSWVMSMNINGAFLDAPANGPGKTQQMTDMLSKAKSGGKVLIEQVKVKAPDGSILSIPGCVIKIK